MIALRGLELFCGTKSFTNVAKKYIPVITVDNRQVFNPDICIDILDYEPKAHYDIIWASPPCESFSIASVGRHWNKDLTPKSKNAELGIKLLTKTIQIIADQNPKYWFIENPRGMMRKVIDNILLEKIGNFYKRETICYCRYGDTRMKPTDIWTNCFEWEPIDRMCKNGNPDHTPAPRGSSTGTQGLRSYKERSRIPSALFEDIFNSIGNIVLI